MFKFPSPSPITYSYWRRQLRVDHRASDQKVAGVSPMSELAMRGCVLGKDTLRLFSIGAKQLTSFGGPALRNICKQNPKLCFALTLGGSRVPSLYKRINELTGNVQNTFKRLYLRVKCSK